MTSKNILIVYSCFNPPLCLITSIQSVYNLQIKNDNAHNYEIVCIDNGSSITTTYNMINKQFPLVKIVNANNKNFEWGAYKYALKHFNIYDIYICLEDTLILKKKLDLQMITNGCVGIAVNKCGFNHFQHVYKMNIEQVLKCDDFKRLTKDTIINSQNDLIKTHFAIAQHNSFIITKTDLHNLFSILKNPAIKKIDSCLYERLFGYFFIQNQIDTIDITNHLIKIPRNKRYYN